MLYILLYLFLAFILVAITSNYLSDIRTYLKQSDKNFITLLKLFFYSGIVEHSKIEKDIINGSVSFIFSALILTFGFFLFTEFIIFSFTDNLFIFRN